MPLTPRGPEFVATSIDPIGNVLGLRCSPRWSGRHREEWDREPKRDMIWIC